MILFYVSNMKYYMKVQVGSNDVRWMELWTGRTTGLTNISPEPTLVDVNPLDMSYLYTVEDDNVLQGDILIASTPEQYQDGLWVVTDNHRLVGGSAIDSIANRWSDEDILSQMSRFANTIYSGFNVHMRQRINLVTLPDDLFEL